MNKLLADDCMKLGFGLMRLPRTDSDNANFGTIDIEQTKKMVDAFIAAGGKYFDTAFIYGGSEEAAKQVLCDRYPRDSYYLATKINAAPFAAKDEAAAKAQLAGSLEKTGAGYFDFYMLHGIDSENQQYFDDYGIWDFVKDAKAKGLVKHIGFSYHDGPELLDQILTDHPEMEFVQLQLNYSDWDDSVVQAADIHRVAVEHDIPIIVMEPLKGSTLANPIKEIKDLFRENDPDASPASWAIRYAASLPNVIMVLSGMSNEAQMLDNLSYMKEFRPLSDQEEQVIDEARRLLKTVDSIPCTACRYCIPGCPIDMHIPEIFSVMNVYKMYGDHDRAAYDYTWRPGGPKASECISCGQCEEACPQHLPIMTLLKETADALE